jgi:hypothetical protein
VSPTRSSANGCQCHFQSSSLPMVSAEASTSRLNRRAVAMRALTWRLRPEDGSYEEDGER